MTFHNGLGQNLQSHKWNSRVILLFSDEFDSEKLQLQRTEIFSDPDGLKDRKLIVYTVLRSGYSKEPFKGEWIKSNQFASLKKSKEDFEVVLIGLDGMVKFRNDSLVPIQRIFDIIDGMPMRRLELKQKN
ncbi:MAG: DUF4174 domain-containing protein [Flavobacteriaceae bacterium]|nr:DUF4174 domain-containing protein [Bacteroidia bacterium]MBT8286708.1 DUF4174 domain-containing protein [Bacteroidia bacterium]NNF74759.1 DUF4174 domain-containing protein [Flavobacteriaceae bacterium]